MWLMDFCAWTKCNVWSPRPRLGGRNGHSHIGCDTEYSKGKYGRQSDQTSSPTLVLQQPPNLDHTYCSGHNEEGKEVGDESVDNRIVDQDGTAADRCCYQDRSKMSGTV